MATTIALTPADVADDLSGSSVWSAASAAEQARAVKVANALLNRLDWSIATPAAEADVIYVAAKLAEAQLAGTLSETTPAQQLETRKTVKAGSVEVTREYKDVAAAPRPWYARSAFFELGYLLTPYLNAPRVRLVRV